MEGNDSPLIDKIHAFLGQARTLIGPEAQGRLHAQVLNLSQAIDGYRRAYGEQLAIDRAELCHNVRLVVLAVMSVVDSGGGSAKALIDRYADLQTWALEKMMVDEVPWLELNDVIEAHLGEQVLEQIKLAAVDRLGGRRSALLRKANPIRNAAGAAPVASYSRALMSRAGRVRNGNRGS